MSADIKPKFKDEFNGDDAHLLRCVDALLHLDEKKCLFPHGLGGHGRSLLSAAAARLEATTAPASISTQAVPYRKGDISGWLRRRAANDLVLIPGKLAGEIADLIDSLKTADAAARTQAIGFITAQTVTWLTTVREVNNHPEHCSALLNAAATDRFTVPLYAGPPE